MTYIEFTGDLWLDGIIYAYGVPQSGKILRITVSRLPAVLAEEIREKFEEKGYDTNYIEQYNGLTKRIDLKLLVSSVDPIFRGLPRLSDRRIPYDIEEEFLDGFLMVITYPHFYQGNDGIRIHYPMPYDDLEYFLQQKGIHKYNVSLQGISIASKDIGNVQPFRRIYEEFKRERDHFSACYGTKEQMLEEKIDKKVDEHLNYKP